LRTEEFNFFISRKESVMTSRGRKNVVFKQNGFHSKPGFDDRKQNVRDERHSRKVDQAYMEVVKNPLKNLQPAAQPVAQLNSQAIILSLLAISAAAIPRPLSLQVVNMQQASVPSVKPNFASSSSTLPLTETQENSGVSFRRGGF
jgi:hypothetical protein